MKRLAAYMLSLLLMLSTVGVDVRAHTCGDMLVALSLNGIEYTTDAGAEMTCCKHGSGCDHCRHTHSHFQVDEDMMAGISAPDMPSMASFDLFFEAAYLMFSEPESDLKTTQNYFYNSLFHPLKIPDCSGLRAPPFLHGTLNVEH